MNQEFNFYFFTIFPTFYNSEQKPSTKPLGDCTQQSSIVTLYADSRPWKNFRRNARSFKYYLWSFVYFHNTLIAVRSSELSICTHVLVKRNGVGRFPDNRFCESEACTFYRGRIGWLIMWFGFLAETGAFGAVQLCESNLVSVGSMNTKHGPVIAHFR
ncbi:uncharacterized protein LOC103488892 [Cucumis melo]|uniref:Uncharacterized protein LOC103488892 n=1 Tax=Cucumis melo TaxID=3656 RepID=A0ABM3L9Z2_CUCME|nr:uncharacterized protein LOC103488892 [Cucumis melo]